jgi:hypothetical protein
MGCGPYRTLDNNWVYKSTYEKLFKDLKNPSSDPEILLANGVIFKNGTARAQKSLSWYKMLKGTPDTLIPGAFSLEFLNETDQKIGETSFEAPFFMYVEPGINVTRYTCQFGRVETDFATFSFATEFPPGTASVQIVNNTDPQKPPLLVVDADSIKTVYADAGGPYFAEEGTPVTFDAGGSLNLDVGTLEYRWDFDGDGTWDTSWSENATTTHTWYDDWIGFAKVNVTNGKSYDIDRVPVSILNVAPTVEAGDDQSMEEGKEISFTADIKDPGDDDHTVNWDFGDGTPTSHEQNPTHIYSNEGIYTVTLNLADDDGGIDSDTLTVVVRERKDQDYWWIVQILFTFVLGLIGAYLYQNRHSLFISSSKKRM